MAPRMTAFESVCGERRSEPDYDRTKLAIFWGVNPLASERITSYAAHGGVRTVISRLKERGVKIVSIDTYRTRTVREANEWDPPQTRNRRRPGPGHDARDYPG